MHIDVSFIKEFQYVTGSYPELDMCFGNNNIQQWYMFNYTHVVYFEFDNCKNVVYLSQSTERYDEAEFKFVNYILGFSNLRLHDVIYLCTLYKKIGVEQELFRPYAGTLNFMNDYLKDTFGKVVYKQQAINLLMLFSDCSYEQADKWIWSLNNGEMSAKAFTTLIKIKNGYSFNDLWNEYTFLKRVYEPKYKIGYKLFQSLKKE